tara:strand:- start:66 stop:494 length:429 start_codon:yes stop_codon:yes gene_type:complete
MNNYALPIRFGVAASGCLVAYFLILSLLGLHIKVYYSLFNVVIIGFAIYEAIKYYNLKKEKEFTYTAGLTTGLITGGVATLTFTCFLVVFSTKLQPGFLGELSILWGNTYQNFETIVFVMVAGLGLISTLVLTLFFMQLFKS